MGIETSYFECNRTGKKHIVEENMRKRKSRQKGTTKLDRGCTSQIIANKTHNGTYNVSYFKTHYGHNLALSHLKLSKKDRGAIASKLLLGVPVNSVLNSAQTTGASEGTLKRINLLQRKDVFNVKRALNISLQDGKVLSSDNINISNFIKECSQFGEQNPIIHYGHSNSLNENTCFIIMTQYQSDFLKKNNTMIVIKTNYLNNCDFQLLTLFSVIRNNIFPCACMFFDTLNRGVFELFFEKIKQKIGIIHPDILITNCDEIYHESWQNVMGDVDHIYNPLQIDLDWNLNLNLIISSDVDVTKIKRTWVYDTLKILQNTTNITEFNESLDETLKLLNDDQDFNDFVVYFLKYFINSKTWALCYKKMEYPLPELEKINQDLNELLNESRFDKVFHSVICFIRTKTISFLLENKVSNSDFISKNDIRHKSLTNKQFDISSISQNMWNILEENSNSNYIVQRKLLVQKCCNLICSSCNICIHCFSCSCVDYFVDNVICEHIHYVWFTIFHSISLMEVSDVDEERQMEQNCFEEEIVIQIDEDTEPSEDLKMEIVEKTSYLCSNIYSVHDVDTLKLILDNVNNACCLIEQNIASEDQSSRDAEYILIDHSYL